MGGVDDLKGIVDALLTCLAMAEADEVDTVTAAAIRVAGRDFAEQLDGADELIRAGGVRSAKILGRTCIELVACVRYLAMKNDERVSSAMFLQSFRAAEETCERYMRAQPPARAQPLTELIKDLRKARINDEYSRQAKLEASRELDRLESGAPWYGIMGGPKTVAQLLRTVGLPNLYQRYYQPWSAMVHGVYLLPADGIESRQVAVRPLRHFAPAEYGLALALLDAIATLAMFHLAHYFTPREVGQQVIDETVELIESLPGDLLIAL